MTQLPTMLSVKYMTLLIGVLLICYGCRPQVGVNTVQTPVESEAPMQVLSFKGNYDRALSAAHAWQPDAYFVSATGTVETNYGPRKLFIIYEFLSTSKNEALLVTVYEDSELETKIVKGGSLTNLPKIDSTDWALDSVQALQIAQENGGAKYLREHGAEARFDLDLEYYRGTTSGPVVWRASYFTSGDDGTLYIEIDAVTGEILAITAPRGARSRSITTRGDSGLP